MRNIFLEKCGGEASPRTFFKKSKLKISLNQQSKFCKVCFYYNFKSDTSEIHVN